MRVRAARILLGVLVAASVAACAWVASAGLDARHEYDESHSLRNVAAILTTGSLEPVFALYPSLSHLPQTLLLALSQALYRWTGEELFAVLTPAGTLAPTAYLLSRWLNVLYGAGCLILTWALGRRLFSPSAGLLAALVLALSPWYVRAATVYKPDPLVMLLTLAVFWWSLDAAERGTLRRYLVAGVGVGLAASTKQTGVLAAIPLVVATLAHPRDRRRWLALGLAGLASALVFLALNPYPDLLGRYLGIAGSYRSWAGLQEPAPHTLVYFPRLVMDGAWHGPWAGGAAWLGLAGWVALLVRRRGSGAPATRLALLVVLPPAFLLACAVVSPHPKANLFLPLLPFTALAAGWALSAALERLARLPPPWGRALPAAGLGALLLVALPPAVRFVHSEAVIDTTLGRAAERIRRHAAPLAHRTVLYESDAGRLEVERRFTRSRGVRVLAVEVAALAALTESELDLADYEVFAERRLHAAGREPYLERLLRLEPEQIWSFDPLPLRRRGSRLLVLAHPWEPVAPAISVAWRTGRGRRALRAQLPGDLPGRQVVSVDLQLTARQAQGCRLWLGAAPFDTWAYAWDDERRSLMSRRFRLRHARGALELECDERRDLRPRPRLELWRWRPGRP